LINKALVNFLLILAPNLTGEEYRFLNKWREEYPNKAEKIGGAVMPILRPVVRL
jgi:hypothetical protein